MDPDLIQKLLKLSQISLTDDELALLQEDLTSIINFVQTMQNVPTDGVEPLAHPLDLVQSLRSDIVRQDFSRDLLQDTAPDVVDGLYRVPKVIERA